jgi:genome maintenance exonuclease 1
MTIFYHGSPKKLVSLSSITNGDTGKRQYQTPDGQLLPSITTVLSIMNRDAISEWRNKVGEEEANRISRYSSGRGTAVHSLCETYLKNEPLCSDARPDAVFMFKVIKPLLNNINKIQYQEQGLYSIKLGVAGSVDCIAEYEGVLSVIDFKTASKPKKEEYIENYFLQTTAYALMYEELIGTPINQIVILIAVDGKEPQVFKKNPADYINRLVEVIDQYKRENKGKP